MEMNSTFYRSVLKLQALKRAEVSSAKDDSIPKEEKQQESAGSKS